MALDQDLVKKICREFCHLSGVDPDEDVILSNDGLSDVAWSGPAWRFSKLWNKAQSSRLGSK